MLKHGADAAAYTRVLLVPYEFMLAPLCGSAMHIHTISRGHVRLHMDGGHPIGVFQFPKLANRVAAGSTLLPFLQNSSYSQTSQ
jgi:hypothetical protein